MKAIFFLYGLACYLIFFATFLYAIGFVGNVVVPKSIDGTVMGSMEMSLAINLVLLSVFALSHSIMARQGFKKKWTKIVSPVIERSTYVFVSSLALILLFWQWRPLDKVIWDFSDSGIGTTLLVLSYVGWGTVLISTFLINHFELFGLKQVYFHLKEKEDKPLPFKTPVLYKFVRHPIYMGFTLAFWATPTMTAGHLLFAIMTFGYVLVGIFFEEKDLVDNFGDAYKEYKSKVSMIFPLPPKK